MGNATETTPKLSHTIQSGESLYDASVTLGISMDFICYFNNLSMDGVLFPGRVLYNYHAAYVEHEVQDGETIEQIAEIYNVKASQILEINSITGEATPGTILKIMENPNSDDVTYRAREGRYDIFHKDKTAEDTRYCTVPFFLMGLGNDHVTPCTWLKKMSDKTVVPVAEETDLKKVWHSDQFTQVRESIVKGNYKHCELNFCPQYMGMQEHFLTLDEMKVKLPKVHDYVKGLDAELQSYPVNLNVGHDTTCNLRCPSCNTDDLVQQPREILDELTNSIATISSDLETLFISGHGDLFASRVYYNFLKDMDLSNYPKLKNIQLNTNGLLWTQEKWEGIPKEVRALVNSATLSIDGASEETYNVNRKGGKFTTLIKRLEYIKTLIDSGEIRAAQISFIYQENNFHEIPAMIEMAKKYSFTKIHIARISNWNGWEEDFFKQKDVADSGHPRHSELASILEEVKNRDEQDIAIIIS